MLNRHGDGILATIKIFGQTAPQNKIGLRQSHQNVQIPPPMGRRDGLGAPSLVEVDETEEFCVTLANERHSSYQCHKLRRIILSSTKIQLLASAMALLT